MTPVCFWSLWKQGLRPQVSAPALGYRSETGLPQVPCCPAAHWSPEEASYLPPRKLTQAQGPILRAKSFLSTPTSYRVDPLCTPRWRKGYHRDSSKFLQIRAEKQGLQLNLEANSEGISYTQK